MTGPVQPASAALSGLPVIFSENTTRHEPSGEVWLGVWDDGTEVPARALVLAQTLAAAGADIIPARPHGTAPLLAVHDAALVEHLATVWDRWEQGGYVSQHGRTRV